jgi:hypothetical protein
MFKISDNRYVCATHNARDGNIIQEARNMLIWMRNAVMTKQKLADTQVTAFQEGGQYGNHKSVFTNF